MSVRKRGEEPESETRRRKGEKDGRGGEGALYLFYSIDSKNQVKWSQPAPPLGDSRLDTRGEGRTSPPTLNHPEQVSSPL